MRAAPMCPHQGRLGGLEGVGTPVDLRTTVCTRVVINSGVGLACGAMPALIMSAVPVSEVGRR
ncbi:hypothetical protein GCM10023257_15730 [Streptomyces hyderabadensis]|uniref:Uncharacterized protein n=1 Tax=Streptomyces hyderabadensis TaxID=598549 RepID=A0ABP9HUD7_9ACTN